VYQIIEKYRNISYDKRTKEDILVSLKSQKRDLADEFGIERLALFGSYSRDEATSDSDIDILFELKKDVKFSIFKYLKLIALLEDSLQHKVDLVRDEKIKPMLKKYIYKDVIYV